MQFCSVIGNFFINIWFTYIFGIFFPKIDTEPSIIIIINISNTTTISINLYYFIVYITYNFIINFIIKGITIDNKIFSIINFFELFINCVWIFIYIFSTFFPRIKYTIFFSFINCIINLLFKN